MRNGVLFLLLWLVPLWGCGGGFGGKAASPATIEPMGAAMDVDGAPMAEMEARDEGGDASFSGGMAPPAPPAGPMLAQAPARGADAPAKQRPEEKGRQATTVDVPTPIPGVEGKPEVAGPKIEPLLIYTAHFHMAVFEAKQSLDAVDKLAKDLGGYLVRREQNSITVRVPAAKYQGALDAIGKMGDVIHRQESVEDVTDQFYDLMTRVKNLRAMRDRLEDLLKQAKNVEEALQVERELARVTGDIESMEGRLKRMRELISFSTITVDFQPRPTETVNSKVRLPFPWLDELGLSNLLSL